MEEIAIVEVGLQEGTRNDGSTWSRWTIKDGNGRTFSTFNEDFAGKLKQGSRALIEFEEKTLTPGRDGSPRKVKNITAVEAANGNVPDEYIQTKPDGARDFDKEALGKTRCAIWKSFLEGPLAANLYAKVVSDNSKQGATQRDPMDYVIIVGTRLVVHAERDVFEREPGGDGVPFLVGDE
jgi:hypothetical protein